MIIRKYINSDKNSILELLRLNTPEYFSPNEEKDLVYYLENHADNFYVVDINNSIQACGGINLSDDGTIGKIAWDIVHPANQGKGFGTQLTKFRIKKIKKIESVKIISVRTSQLVYKFYEKFGLEIKEIVKDFWDEGFDLYRMENDINNV